ncbi:MAG: phosphoglucosamine mutase [Bacteroidales bacterium]|nr:phosphoglucosamine mutase [Bacteroidales bacterium]
MSLIKSISGIRGTIGGKENDTLHPSIIVKLVLAYGELIKNKNQHILPLLILVGRDGRTSGEFIQSIVEGTLLSQGFEVGSLDLTTTPTIEIAIPFHKAAGGIMITASHNPPGWNALKFLDENGEFLSPKAIKELIELSENYDFATVPEDALRSKKNIGSFIPEHINQILSLDLVDVEAIRKRRFKVVADVINSTGALALPLLFDALGVEAILINETPFGKFAHEPEPLPENLQELSKIVQIYGADLGIAVDPDVDRLVLIQSDGTPFSEEYTLVAAADYVLSQKRGNTVSNYSSTMALRDVTHRYGCIHYQSPVGEIHVVEKMKAVNAIIGGEGNGGVILPSLHYGRDALVGIALILSGLAQKKISLNEWRKLLPSYEMIKTKIKPSLDFAFEHFMRKIKEHFTPHAAEIIEDDGIKLIFQESWIHIRKSNTEPLIRIIAEAKNANEANHLIELVKKMI